MFVCTTHAVSVELNPVALNVTVAPFAALAGNRVRVLVTFNTLNEAEAESPVFPVTVTR